MTNSKKLTKKQKEVLDKLLSGDFTVLQLSQEYNCSVQNIYKIVKIIERKGYLKGFLKNGLIKPYPPTLQSTNRDLNLSKFIRLHGVEFHIVPYYPNPISATDRYSIIRNLGNLIHMSGWTIRLFPESFEIYSGEQQEWKGETVQRATALMQQDFNKLIYKLESRLNIGIIKDSKHNIRVVNSHYAEVNNGFAQEMDKNKIKITLYGKDGYAWFKIDTSWNFNEAETIHPQLSKEDAQKIFEKHLNTWRDPNTMTNIELQDALAKTIKQNEFITQSLATLSAEMNSHTAFIQASAKILNITLKRSKSKQTTLKQSGNKKLNEFF